MTLPEQIVALERRLGLQEEGLSAIQYADKTTIARLGKLEERQCDPPGWPEAIGKQLAKLELSTQAEARALEDRFATHVEQGRLALERQFEAVAGRITAINDSIARRLGVLEQAHHSEEGLVAGAVREGIGDTKRQFTELAESLGNRMGRVEQWNKKNLRPINEQFEDLFQTVDKVGARLGKLESEWKETIHGVLGNERLGVTLEQWAGRLEKRIDGLEADAGKAPSIAQAQAHRTEAVRLGNRVDTLETNVNDSLPDLKLGALNARKRLRELEDKQKGPPSVPWGVGERPRASKGTPCQCDACKRDAKVMGAAPKERPFSGNLDMMKGVQPEQPAPTRFPHRCPACTGSQRALEFCPVCSGTGIVWG